jgi:hypothetical protein
MHTIINTLQDNAPIYRLPVLFVGIHLAAQVHLQVGPKFEHAMVHEMIDLEGVGTVLPDGAAILVRSISAISAGSFFLALLMAHTM